MGIAGARLRDRGVAPGGTCLTRLERRVLEALVDRLFPGDGAVPVRGRDLEVARRVEAYLAQAPREVRLLIRLLLLQLEFGPPLLIRRVRRFTSLTPAEQERYLERWDGHPWYPLRGGFLLLKILTGVVYYDDPAVLRALGHDRRCLREGVSLDPGA